MGTGTGQMRKAIFAVVSAILLLAPAIASAQDNGKLNASPGPDVIKSCQTCHGAGGNSSIGSTPRLNGQQAAYLSRRLRLFRETATKPLHPSTDMLGAVSHLSDAAISSVANYFAKQPPTEPDAISTPLAAEGERIYQSGIKSENVIACKLCHDAHGKGHGDVPRLAGQHKDYMKNEIMLFSVKFRDNKLMHPNAENISAHSLDAVAAYLAKD